MVGKRKQRGFSLMELLVSLTIISIGLLSIVAMQTTSLRHSHSAEMRSVALAQAYSMVDRMRANRTGVQSGNYNNLAGTPTDPGCAPCTPGQTAQKDLFEWNTINTQRLPNGQGRVTGNNSVFSITVMWDNERTGATGTACGGNPSDDLTCVTIQVIL